MSAYWQNSEQGCGIWPASPGTNVGVMDGASDGTSVGYADAAVGCRVGRHSNVGTAVGKNDGEGVTGAAVHMASPVSVQSGWHSSYSISSGQGFAVIPDRSRITHRDRCLVPSPQLTEHALHSCQVSTRQSCGHVLVPHGFGQAVRLSSGGCGSSLGLTSTRSWSTNPFIDNDVTVTVRLSAPNTTLSLSSRRRAQFCAPTLVQNVVSLENS